VANLFFLVSGENPSLPSSEVKSILEAEGFAYHVLEELIQVLRIEADPRCATPIEHRSAMTRICGTEILNCEANLGTILENVKRADVSPFISEGESFAVRVKRVRESPLEVDGWALEQEIGEVLFKNVGGNRVNLKTPQKTFLGVLTAGRFVFGLKTAEIKSGEFIKRGPRRRAFFHPSAMPAKLARCMVNLAQPRTGELVMDPFCGTGSFLVEAGLMGCRVLGLDVKRGMVGGSLRNLSFYGLGAEGLAVADVRSAPLADRSVDCIATDPPYGISATTLGLNTGDLIEGFLSAVGDVVKRGRRICLAAPKTVKVNEIGERLGFKHLESHFMHVHRSLTREVAVFKRD
jgi:tRNA (guanine10-N2)-dimethyltransferase